MKLDSIEINTIVQAINGEIFKWEEQRAFWSAELANYQNEPEEELVRWTQYKKIAEYHINKLVACRDKLRMG